MSIFTQTLLTGTGFWNPLAWTIIFGLTFTTILTLIVVPVVYSSLDSLAAIARQAWGWFWPG